MSTSVLWSVESDRALDDRVQSQINAALGIAFHGVSSPGAHTVGHRFLIDDDDGSLILRVAMRTQNRYAIELVSVGSPDLGNTDVSEWRRRAENATQIEKYIGSPADDYFLSANILEFYGDAVRITPPEFPPLMLPGLAPFNGAFHSEGEPMPLYCATNFITAWASQVGAQLHKLASGGVERRVSNFEIHGVRLFDLQRALVSLRMPRPDPLSHKQQQLIRELIWRAQEVGAEGLLYPSRYAIDGKDLVIFADALHRVTIRNTRVVELSLADATHDIKVRARLESDEHLRRQFVAALNDGTFERQIEIWQAETTVTEEEASGLRDLAKSVTGHAR